MSPSEAQKSPVHAATEDSTAEPSGPTAQPPGPPAASGGGGGGGEVGGGASGVDVSRQAGELKSRPDTAMGVPGNFERGAAMAGRHPDTDQDANPPGAIGGGPGAGDASSGGGAGAGVPGGGTDMRTGGALSGGDADEDRQRLFPDAPGGTAGRTRGATGSASGDQADRNNPDESSFAGPLNLDDPNAV